MFQRVLLLILIPCMLLNQSAALTHCHGHHGDSTHGSRAHIHLHWSNSEAEPQEHSHHSHAGHGHGHCHNHSHADVHKQCSLTSENRDSLKQDICSVPFQHDAHCIYVAGVIAIDAKRLALEEFGGQLILAGRLIDLIAFDLADHHTSANRYYRPPPLPSLRCPLYLRHLSLLI